MTWVMGGNWEGWFSRMRGHVMKKGRLGAAVLTALVHCLSLFYVGHALLLLEQNA